MSEYPHVTKNSKGQKIKELYEDGSYHEYTYYDDGELKTKTSPMSKIFPCYREYHKNPCVLSYARYHDGKELWFNHAGEEIDNPAKVLKITLKDIADKFGINIKSLRIVD
jgi:hypothetical protein